MLPDEGRLIQPGESGMRHAAARAFVTVCVGMDLLASGSVDAFVSAGHTGVTVAAAVLRLGRLPGVARPALAVVIPALAGPVVLLDAGAAPDASPESLLHNALAGWAYARALGLRDPAVGLLTIGSEAGKADQLRRSAHELLAPLLADAAASPLASDAKSQLRQWAESQGFGPPHYDVTVSGPDHDPLFFVRVSVDHAVVGEATGRSKKAAEVAAALAAWEGRRHA